MSYCVLSWLGSNVLTFVYSQLISIFHSGNHILTETKYQHTLWKFICQYAIFHWCLDNWIFICIDISLLSGSFSLQDLITNYSTKSSTNRLYGNSFVNLLYPIVFDHKWSFIWLITVCFKFIFYASLHNNGWYWIQLQQTLCTLNWKFDIFHGFLS